MTYASQHATAARPGPSISTRHPSMSKSVLLGSSWMNTEHLSVSSVFSTASSSASSVRSGIPKPGRAAAGIIGIPTRNQGTFVCGTQYVLQRSYLTSSRQALAAVRPFRPVITCRPPLMVWFLALHYRPSRLHPTTTGERPVRPLPQRTALSRPGPTASSSTSDSLASVAGPSQSGNHTRASASTMVRRNAPVAAEQDYIDCRKIRSKYTDYEGCELHPFAQYGLT